MKTCAIITAGGTSSRFGNKNKLLEKIHNKEVIRYTVEAFEKSDVDEIIICANKSIISTLNEMFSHKIIEGGPTRQASVYNGLKAINCDYVLIHDGARPFVDESLIIRTLAAATVTGGAVPALRVTDAVKKLGKDGLIAENIDRSSLITVQTPQIFRKNEILDAYDKFPGLEADDDAAVFIAAGYECTVSRGSAENRKITYITDIPDAEKQAAEYVKAREEGRKSAAASKRMRELLQQGDKWDESGNRE